MMAENEASSVPREQQSAVTEGDAIPAAPGVGSPGNTAQPESGVDKTETDDGSSQGKQRRRKLIKGTRNTVYESFSLHNRDESGPKKKHYTASDNFRSGDHYVPSERPQRAAERSPAVPEPEQTKPEWMKEDDFADFSKRVNATVGGQQPRRMKRNRKTIEDQRREAEQYRLRAEAKEQRMVENNLQSYQQHGNMRPEDVVRSHYNARTHISRGVRRNNSPIIKLRKFNNIIKYMLINKFVTAEDKVLDLGCGKGGDLHKWHKARVSQYIGIDISNESILEAIRRFRTIRSASFESVFATGDAFNTPVPELLQQFPQVEFPVDLVTMQFVMHYAFSTEESVRNLLQNISKSLKVGGTFIGTIPSSDVIKERIEALPPGEKKFGNSIYSVEFDDVPPRGGEFDSIAGNRYTYFLEDAVDHVPEFVVPFELFRAMAEEYDLSLIYKKQFSELFTEEIPHWIYRLERNTLEGIRQDDGTYGIAGDEFEASDFYLAFAFQRVGFS